MSMQPNQNPSGSRDDGRDANNAYSGSGTMQPGGNAGEPGQLSDYPEGNLEDIESLEDELPNRQPDAQDGGRTIGEATDPSKLSDI